MSNHYRTLGLGRDADDAAIRSAYLELIRRYHPDRGGEEADAARAQEITAAYEALRNAERRAAYDAGRQATFRPLPAGGGARTAAGGRVRGGHAARNLFLLLAAGTAALGWWAVQQPIGGPARTAAVTEPGAVQPPPDEPAILPRRQEQTVEELAETPTAPSPVEVEEPEMVLPPLPVARASPLPERAPETRVAERMPVQRRQEPLVSAMPVPEPVAVAAARPAVDVAGLERHLRLLTDQSVRFADEGRRARLFATRDAFLDRLSACRDDYCRRDVYLRRNQEVAEIMRR